MELKKYNVVHYLPCLPEAERGIETIVDAINDTCAIITAGEIIQQRFSATQREDSMLLDVYEVLVHPVTEPWEWFAGVRA